MTTSNPVQLAARTTRVLDSSLRQSWLRGAVALSMALASTGLATRATAACVDVPNTATGAVVVARDGMRPDGFAWRAWAEAAPAPVTIGVVGQGRADGFLGDLGNRAAAGDGPWLVAVEGESGGAGYFAVGRAAAAGALKAFPSMQLAKVPRPEALGSTTGVVVRWALPAMDGGLPEGLTAWSVRRSVAGSNAAAEVARVPPSTTEVVDAAARPGTWNYRLVPIFSGGVQGLHASQPSENVRVGGGLGGLPRPQLLRRTPRR